MAWQDRLRDAAYTSPSGQRLTFDYDATSEVFEQLGGAFNFPDAKGTFVQPLGASGRRYPLRLILWGADYDQAAASWMDALQEAGVGTLEHPAYGRKTVVPTGSVTRRDEFVRGANQAVIEVSFFETTGLAYPSPQSLDDTAAKVEAASVAQAQTLAASGVLDSASDRADFLSRYESALGAASGALKPITEAVASAQRQFTAIESSINRGIDVLIRDPLTLAYQTQQLIKTPARIAASAGARLDAYGDFLSGLVGTTPPRKTALYNTDMYATATLTATALATTTTEYTKRPEAIEAAELILEQAEAVAAWRDDNFAALGEIDDGGVWQSLQDLVASTAGALVQRSFTLASERRVVLTSDRSIIDLTFELYGTVDDKLDALINDNDLSGDEIIEIKRGREVVYYVA